MIDSIIEKINELLKNKAFKNIYNDLFKEKLCNKTIKLSIIDIERDFYIVFQNDNIMLSNKKNDEDVTISGTISSLFFYSTIGKSQLFASKINISGDVETANALNNLLHESDFLRRISIEIMGQKAASNLFSFLDPIKEKLNENRERQDSALADFLRFDINMIPSKDEINDYIDAVDDVKTRTDKLLNRLK
tara:strand:+ start:6798 stop:7370 length:573 start_codon:yes stop_codon:yes gene_type:complete